MPNSPSPDRWPEEVSGNSAVAAKSSFVRITAVWLCGKTHHCSGTRHQFYIGHDHKMTSLTSLQDNLRALGVLPGDGIFVHASMHAIGPTIGGPRAVVQALLSAVGSSGLIGMPGFSTDAYFPRHLDRSALSEDTIQEIENAVPGFDINTSPTAGMGVIAETFRTWPETKRSDHPAVSICLNGQDATEYISPHSLAWATGPDTPLGRLRFRNQMKILLIGVGWNRCSALHTAESLADDKRTKSRRFKTGPGDAPWIETPDVADDLDRLFPLVGAAFEDTNAVTIGRFGGAGCKLCDYAPLVGFAAEWINKANRQSGDQH